MATEETPFRGLFNTLHLSDRHVESHLKKESTKVGPAELTLYWPSLVSYFGYSSHRIFSRRGSTWPWQFDTVLDDDTFEHSEKFLFWIGSGPRDLPSPELISSVSSLLTFFFISKESFIFSCLSSLGYTLCRGKTEPSPCPNVHPGTFYRFTTVII